MMPIDKETAQKLRELREKLDTLRKRKYQADKDRLAEKITFDQFRLKINNLNLEMEEVREKMRELRKR